MGWDHSRMIRALELNSRFSLTQKQSFLPLFQSPTLFRRLRVLTLDLTFLSHRLLEVVF